MYRGPSSSRRLAQKEPRNPNLIPIMNLFIVVIPMLMTIMVSVHLAMIEITLPTSQGEGGGGEQQEEIEDPPKAITIGLYTDRFEIQVEGEKVEEIQTLGSDEASNVITYDFVHLDKRISELKEEHETQNTIDVLPDNKVKYDILLRTIDICKNNGFPNITYKTYSKKHIRAKQ